MPTILLTLYIFGMQSIMKTNGNCDSYKNIFGDDSIILKNYVKSKPLGN